MSLYKICGVTKTYGEKDSMVTALNNINIEIERGKFVVILGASGSGKSTLLNILGGMDTPQEGSIYFDDEEITKFKSSRLTRFRREKVGFVFQSYNLLPQLTALENVQFSTEISKLSDEDAKKAIAAVGLSHRMNHFPSEMSGGEQQRISIARAIAKKPQVLLCDEPTGALDYKTGVMVLTILKDINRQFGSSVILITHSQEIAKTANIVIRMRSGEIIEKQINENPLNPNEVEW